jgi:hypothetical protein
VTRKEWDARWLLEYDSMWMETRDHRKAFAYAQHAMVHTFGPRPDGDLGPPLVAKLWALANGVPMTFLSSLWKWLDGKKVIIGAIITTLSVIASSLPAILAAFGLEAVQISTIMGIVLMVVGICHKIYKFIYKEDHP